MRLPVVLAVLLFAPLALGAPSGIRLDASAARGVIELALTADAPGELRVVLVRDDPLLGPVVDRIAPVTVDADGSVNVSLDGIRGGSDLTIKVLPVDAELPLLANVTNVVDGVKLLLVPALANVTGLDVPRSSDDAHTIRGYPVGEGTAMGCTCHLATSPKGSVVASWLAPPVAGSNTATIVTVAVSTDGGHTFGAPRDLNSNLTTSVTNFAWAEREGDLFFLFEEFLPTSPATGEWSNTRLVRLDGATGAIVSTVSLPRSVPAVNLWGSAVRSDGALLIAYPNTAHVDGAPRPGLGIAQILRNGSFSEIATIALAENAGFAGYAHVVADRAGHVAVAFTEFATGTVRVLRSDDGGRTWPTEHAMMELNTLGDKRSVHVARLDDVGTIHVANVVEHPRIYVNASGSTGQYDNTSLAYARIPLAGPASVVALSGRQLRDAIVPTGDTVETPQLVVRGPRVWIVWNSVDRTQGASATAATYGIESTSSGATFGEPYPVQGEGSYTPWIPSIQDMALLPDGRPILLAWYPHPAPVGIRLSVFPFFDPLAPVNGVSVVLPANPITPDVPPEPEDDSSTTMPTPSREPIAPAPTVVSPSIDPAVPPTSERSTTPTQIGDDERANVVVSAAPLLVIAVLAALALALRRRA